MKNTLTNMRGDYSINVESLIILINNVINSNNTKKTNDEMIKWCTELTAQANKAEDLHNTHGSVQVINLHLGTFYMLGGVDTEISRALRKTTDAVNNPQQALKPERQKETTKHAPSPTKSFHTARMNWL